MKIPAATRRAIAYPGVLHPFVRVRPNGRVASSSSRLLSHPSWRSIHSLWRNARIGIGLAAQAQDTKARLAKRIDSSVLLRISVGLKPVLRLLETSKAALVQPITVTRLELAHQHLLQAQAQLTQARQCLTAQLQPLASGTAANQRAITLLTSAIYTVDWMLADIADRHISKASPLLPMAQQVQMTLIQLIQHAVSHSSPELRAAAQALERLSGEGRPVLHSGRDTPESLAPISEAHL